MNELPSRRNRKVSSLSKLKQTPGTYTDETTTEQIFM